MKLARNVTSDNKEHQKYKEMVPGFEQEELEPGHCEDSLGALIR